MGIFYALKANKGTVSSALGKQLAADALAGDLSILEEAVRLTCYDRNNPKAKHIRAGAAKIVEIVAEQEPALVAPYMDQLMPALEVAETQTRWMTIRTLGFCAKDAPQTAARGIPFAVAYLKENAGVCLSSSAELYLGAMGAVSVEYARQCFPLLIQAFADLMPNEVDWIIEAFLALHHHLGGTERKQVLQRLDAYEKQEAGQLKASTLSRFGKLRKCL